MAGKMGKEDIRCHYRRQSQAEILRLVGSLPVGEGLRGHPRPAAMDIIARKQDGGLQRTFPRGFDIFGLPTENYAIKHHMHPRKVTERNIARFTNQLKMLGFSFDWDRCIDTLTQVLQVDAVDFPSAFQARARLQDQDARQLVHLLQCVLANEGVVNGVCERCSSEVVRREKPVDAEDNRICRPPY